MIDSLLNCKSMCDMKKQSRSVGLGAEGDYVQGKLVEQQLNGFLRLRRWHIMNEQSALLAEDVALFGKSLTISALSYHRIWNWQNRQVCRIRSQPGVSRLGDPDIWC